MPHPSADRACQAEGFISAGDALLEFAAEPTTVIAGSPPGRATVPPSPSATRASVAVSERALQAGAALPKVISPLVAFVLGFVLATSMAWLVSTPSGVSMITSRHGPSLSAVEPVLAASSAPILVAPAIVPMPGTVAPTKEEVETPAQPPRRKVPAALASPARVRSQPAAARFRGVLAVSSQPEGAEVLLNGTPVGRTPMILDSVAAGSHAIFVRQDGYASWSSSIRVVADQRTLVSSILNPLVTR
jgi:hypothetical protein